MSSASFPRKRESIDQWIPAYAGMTQKLRGNDTIKRIKYPNKVFLYDGKRKYLYRNLDSALKRLIPKINSFLSSGQIILTTSGSTGTPKTVIHNWQSILSSISVSKKGENAIWLLTYDLGSFAALQVIFHALLNGATLVMAGNDPASVIRRHRITHLSATPSFWRKLLLQVSPKDLSSLKHITLGGEAISQDLLNRLKTLFPKTAITQIYASTEMGACFYVKDKKAGLPLSILKAKGEVRARIKKGELWIQSVRSMKRYGGGVRAPIQGGWFATGDLVKKEGERIHFVSRKQDIINVGGFKVYPFEVEELIYEIPEVIQARVYGQKSSLLGEIVACDLEVRPQASHEAVRQKVITLCQKKLARQKAPRLIHFNEQLVKGSKIRRS